MLKPSSGLEVEISRIDVTYVGPGSAVNGYVASQGKDRRIISGAASGGAVFVVRNDSGIKSPKASPQLGNRHTQPFDSICKITDTKRKTTEEMYH